MNSKFRIFISSVQSEFAEERRSLAKYIRSDAMLGRFFDVFLFEECPASDRSARDVYLSEVAGSDLYLGLVGEKFGNEIESGVSATQAEYMCATKHAKKRLVFLKDVRRRDPRESSFVQLIDSSVTRRSFRSYDELQLGVYAALVAFLEDAGYVRMAPFDLAFDTDCTKKDLDASKIRDFIRRLREEGKITVPKSADTTWVLTKLEALAPNGRVSNAAVLLFGKEPQRKFMSSCVKCLQYWGTKVERPVPSYQTFEGGLVDMIESAIAFVMSRIDREIAVPNAKGVAGAKDELPLLAVREAIVNAVCHRDYAAHGSVQIMLFRDRLEIINPGTLPSGWTVEMLTRTHDSAARNECLAKALNWAGFVEQSGHGTETIVDQCVEQGLACPEYRPDTASFHTIIWRRCYGGGPVVAQSSGPVVAQSWPSRILAKFLDAETSLSTSEIAKAFGMVRASGSVKRALVILLSDGLIVNEVSKKNSRLQKYRITDKGRKLANSLWNQKGRL